MNAFRRSRIADPFGAILHYRQLPSATVQRTVDHELTIVAFGDD